MLDTVGDTVGGTVGGFPEAFRRFVSYFYFFSQSACSIAKVTDKPPEDLRFTKYHTKYHTNVRSSFKRTEDQTPLALHRLKR